MSEHREFPWSRNELYLLLEVIIGSDYTIDDIRESKAFALSTPQMMAAHDYERLVKFVADMERWSA